MREQLSDSMRDQIQRAVERKYVVCATCVNIWFNDQGILASKKGKMLGGRGTSNFTGSRRSTRNR